MHRHGIDKAMAAAVRAALALDGDPASAVIVEADAVLVGELAGAVAGLAGSEVVAVDDLIRDQRAVEGRGQVGRAREVHH